MVNRAKPTRKIKIKMILRKEYMHACVAFEQFLWSFRWRPGHAIERILLFIWNNNKGVRMFFFCVVQWAKALQSKGHTSVGMGGHVDVEVEEEMLLVC